ncbi:basic leucine zipper 43 [Populus alba x Populus x berolinensis]|nr:basic leucine zipper 43 [Populus alba x Populus x berolinensis]KAJ6872007.1 basic leucine zipper 43 [Populus alba x Populus x berolinensis]
MFFAQEAVQLEHPVHGPGFTANEIQELLSLLQSPSPTENSGSRGSNQAVYSIDERKRRRMVSNRESARRSRWRKKKHLEDLTQQLNRLKIQNRELQNRLGSIINQSHVLWRENGRLMSESVALKARLSDLRLVLAAMNAMQQAQ